MKFWKSMKKEKTEHGTSKTFIAFMFFMVKKQLKIISVNSCLFVVLFCVNGCN